MNNGLHTRNALRRVSREEARSASDRADRLIAAVSIPALLLLFVAQLLGV